MHKCVPFAFLLLFSTLFLPGCGGDMYSPAINYLVRSDPLVTDPNLGPEQYEPERPGIMPMFSLKDLEEKRNPLHGRTDLGKKLLDPRQMDASARQELEELLTQHFGTPANPKVEGVKPEVISLLQLAPDKLANGSRLYRLHCLHCHGVSGDGRGPTAKWVHPHPRDYRQGLFKFQSTDQADGQDRHPRREDLVRTLEEGIEGTSMPSFRLLPPADLNDLASYVIHLSLRGEMEYFTIRYIFVQTDNPGKIIRPVADDDDPRTSVQRFKDYLNNMLGKRWFEAQSRSIDVKGDPTSPKDLKKSVQRGQALFLADEKIIKEFFPKINEDGIKGLKAASCVSCHVDYGRRANFKYDSWGTLTRSANLTSGVYRGGRRPVDFYYRIHSGINGSNMPRFGKTLNNQQIWDVINFLQVLPYPAMRKEFGLQID